MGSGSRGPGKDDAPATRLFTVLVCYDIADDSRRVDVSEVLSEVGVRVQFSVFECKVRGRRELRALESQLRSIIEPSEDQVRMYNFGSRQAVPKVLGQRTLEEWRDYWIV